METDYIIVYTTCATLEEAEWLEAQLLQNHVAACVQKDTTSSSYYWRGNLQTTTEIRLTIKTKKALFTAVEGVIRGGSSYQVPEIVAVPITHGNKSYLSWVDRVTTPQA